VLDRLEPTPRVLALHAHDFEGMFSDLRELGEAIGADPRALEKSLRRRIETVTRRARGLRPKRVFCMEWLEPVYTTGHWVPQMVDMVRGRDVLAHPRKNSRRVEWADVVAAAPEALILMPCGLTMERTRKELPVAARRPEWARLPAVARGEVYQVDGPAYFNGAGPRLVDGLEILAEILHPAEFPRRHRRGWTKIGT